MDGLNPPLQELWSRIRSGDRNPSLDLVREGITASDAEVVRIFVDVVSHLRPSAVVDNTVEIVASALDDLRRLGSRHDVLCASPLFARLAETLEDARQQVLREVRNSKVLSRGGLGALAQGLLDRRPADQASFAATTSSSTVPQMRQNS